VHNQLTATINLFKLCQECHQSPQEFHDQFIAMGQVCEQLGLKIGQSEQATKSLLKRDVVKNLMEEQLKTLVIPRCRSRMRSCSFVWLTITDMESSSKIWRVQCYARKPFPKNVSNACRPLTVWWNNYGGKSINTESNIGVAFNRVSSE